MSNNFCHTPNINLFRGAAYEIAAVKCFLHLICQNFRKFATLCPGLPQFAIICYPAETCQAIYLHQLCKKYLTTAGLLLYNRRRAFKRLSRDLLQIILDIATFCAYTTRVGTGSGTKTGTIVNNLHHTRKKDLTFVALLLIMAQATPHLNYRCTTTGAPAPIFKD